MPNPWHIVLMKEQELTVQRDSLWWGREKICPVLLSVMTHVLILTSTHGKFSIFFFSIPSRCHVLFPLIPYIQIFKATKTNKRTKITQLFCSLHEIKNSFAKQKINLCLSRFSLVVSAFFLPPNAHVQQQH